MSIRPIILMSFAIVCLAPGVVLADSHRMETTPTGWWWHYNLTESDIQDIINDNDARLMDIEIHSHDPLRFTAAFVHNSGVYQEGWWWYYNVTVSDIETLLRDNEARLIDIERYPTVAGPPRYAAIMLDNSGQDAKVWWWYVNTNEEFLTDILLDNEARLVDIETYQDDGLKFAAIMVDNTGADAMVSWWYFNEPATTIWNNIAAHGTRLLESEVHDPVANTYDAILIPNDGPDSINCWWYYDLTAEELNANLRQNGARITDVDTYLDGAGRRYSAVMVNNTNDLTTKMGNLLDYGSYGSTGVYLKEVGGPVLASLQPTFVYEPSSSLKVIHHLYAMRKVMFGVDDLNNHFTVAEGISGRSCPNDGPPFNDQTLSATLSGMMWRSDNTDTRAIELRYGREAINDTSAVVVGMTDTSINRRMGCNEGPLNELTLVDAARLYEGVAQGLYLDSYHRELFYVMMQSENTVDSWWFTWQMEDLIEEVATDLGIPDAAADYWDNTRLAWKPGGDNMDLGEFKVYRSVSGWVSLPWDCEGSSSQRKDFVFGLFIHAADDTNHADFRLFNHTIELFREQVTAGLIECVSAAENLPVVQSMLGQNVPNPFNPHTTIAFEFPRQEDVTLKVFDMAGRLVRSLIAAEPYPPGRHEVVWNGRDDGGRQVASGTYFYRLETGRYSETKRMVLIK